VGALVPGAKARIAWSVLNTHTSQIRTHRRRDHFVALGTPALHWALGSLAL